MSFEITTTRHFAAAHALRLPGGGIEPVHGHNWRVKVTVASEALDAIGTVMDFHQLEPVVDAIVVRFHNRHLNELPPFDAELNPSAENVAFHVGRSIGGLPAGVRLVSVEVWETEDNSAVWRQ